MLNDGKTNYGEALIVRKQGELLFTYPHFDNTRTRQFQLNHSEFSIVFAIRSRDSSPFFRPGIKLS